MKNLITILILFVAVGCGKTEVEKVEAGNKTLEDSVVGTYRNDGTEFIFRSDKVMENRAINEDGSLGKNVDVHRWEVKNDEVVTTGQEEMPSLLYGGNVVETYGFQRWFFRKRENGDLTIVASGYLKDEKEDRQDKAMEDFVTYKKLKE